VPPVRRSCEFQSQLPFASGPDPIGRCQLALMIHTSVIGCVFSELHCDFPNLYSPPYHSTSLSYFCAPPDGRHFSIHHRVPPAQHWPQETPPPGHLLRQLVSTSPPVSFSFRSSFSLNSRLKKIKCLQPSPETKCEACKAAKIPCRFKDRERYFAERSRAIAGPNTTTTYALDQR
jgi:hypothetical protein